MRKMTAFSLLVFLVLISQFNSQAIFAESKVSAATSELLKKMDKAINVEALKSTKSLSYIMTSSMPAEKISYTSEVISIKNKALLKINISGKEQLMGFDGNIAWKNDKKHGIREISGKEKDSVTHATIDFMLNQRVNFAEILPLADEKFEEKDCFVLNFKKDGEPDKKTFEDKSTFLILGTISIVDSPLDKVNVKTTFNSYKKCDNGYLIADSTTIDTGTMKIITTCSDIKIDPIIDEKIFDQPESGIKSNTDGSDKKVDQ